MTGDRETGSRPLSKRSPWRTNRNAPDPPNQGRRIQRSRQRLRNSTIPGDTDRALKASSPTGGLPAGLDRLASQP
jgi:hypothetical protein